MRDGHRRHRFSGDMTSLEDHQIGGRMRLVDDEADEPALILGGAGMGGNEDELTRIPTGPEFPDLSLARLKIMPKQATIAQRGIGAGK